MEQTKALRPKDTSKLSILFFLAQDFVHFERHKTNARCCLEHSILRIIKVVRDDKCIVKKRFKLCSKTTVIYYKVKCGVTVKQTKLS